MQICKVKSLQLLTQVSSGKERAEVDVAHFSKVCDIYFACLDMPCAVLSCSVHARACQGSEKALT